MTDRGFSHPNAGRQVIVTQHGKEVHLIFVCTTQAMSDSLVEDLQKQLKGGAINLTLMGKPTKIEDARS